MVVNYIVSKKEIIRRKKAFLSLSVSLLLGLVLASVLFNFPIIYSFFGAFAVILLLANLSLNRFFKSYLSSKICLSNDYLSRIKENGTKRFLIKDIKKIKINNTTNNTIREMGIYFYNGESIFINGLSNFEKFRTRLFRNISKNVSIKKTREPMNFDSVFFYPILGLILSFGTIYLLKLMTSFSYQTMLTILEIFMIYVFLVVVYLIFSKPISSRY